MKTGFDIYKIIRFLNEIPFVSIEETVLRIYAEHVWRYGKMDSSVKKLTAKIEKIINYELEEDIKLEGITFRLPDVKEKINYNVDREEFFKFVLADDVLSNGEFLYPLESYFYN